MEPNSEAGAERMLRGALCGGNTAACVLAVDGRAFLGAREPVECCTTKSLRES